MNRPTNRFSNREVAALLAGVAARLQILEANRFRVIALNCVLWYRVRAADGLVGWVMADGIELSDPAE